MLEAEDALRVLRERFERTEDPEIQAELAARASGWSSAAEHRRAIACGI